MTPTLLSLTATHEACAGQSRCSFPGVSAGARMTTAAAFPQPASSHTGIAGRALMSMAPHRGPSQVTWPQARSHTNHLMHLYQADCPGTTEGPQHNQGHAILTHRISLNCA